jgi:hypothetical protein
MHPSKTRGMLVPAWDWNFEDNNSLSGLPTLSNALTGWIRMISSCGYQLNVADIN